MDDVRWSPDGERWTAYGSIQFEGPDGPELTDLYLTVRPSEEVDDADYRLGWRWDVSISMEDAGFGDETFESDVEPTIQRAQAACIAYALELIDSEGGGSLV